MGCVVIINIKHGPTVQRWLVTSRSVKFASLHLAGSTNCQAGDMKTVKDTVALWPRHQCGMSPAAGRSLSSARWSFCPGQCSEATPSLTQTAPLSLCSDGLPGHKNKTWDQFQYAEVILDMPVWMDTVWERCSIDISSVLKLLRNATLTLHRRKLLVQYRIY